MAPFDEPRVKMGAEELHLLRDLLRESCGFNLREDLQFIAERRLASRLELLGLPDFRAYYRYLRFDPKGPDELEAATDLLVPHETYFFREPAQLACYAREVWPLLREGAGRRPVRAWSAGCSTGEEPYTLAMLAAEAGDEEPCEVVGTDLSRRALGTARAAEYGPSALRATDPARRERFFTALPHGRVRVRDELRDRVHFGQLNLLDQAGAGRLLPVDVVFCRNVLIYFEPPVRKRVVELLYERLVPGGILLLGHAENLFSLDTPFEVLQLEGDLVYRRPRA